MAVADDADDVANKFEDNAMNNELHEDQIEGDYSIYLTNDEIPSSSSSSSSGTMNQVPYNIPQQPMSYIYHNYDPQFHHQKANYPPSPPLPRYYNIGSTNWGQFQTFGYYNNIPQNYQLPAVRNFNCTALGHVPYNRMVQHPYNNNPFYSGNAMPLRFDQDLGRNMAGFQILGSGCNSNFRLGAHNGSMNHEMEYDDQPAMKKRGSIGGVEGEKKENENCHAANQVLEPEPWSTSRNDSPASTTTA